MADKKYVRNQLVKKTLAELRTIWTDDEGLDISDFDDDHKKADLINALLEIEAPEDEELEDEIDLEDEEEELADEEEDLPDEDDLELPEEDDIEEEAPAEKPAKKTRAKKPAAAEGTLAAKQVATLLNTEAKTLRQFFRSPASTIEAVGSGGRYEFNEADLPTITKEFEAWKAGHASRAAKRAEGGSSRKSRKAEAPIEVEEIEELEIEDLEEEELELEDED